jgi:glycosyltransferase involved in cell wall biosynthesis
MATRLTQLRILITTDFFIPWANGVGSYVETLATFFPEAHITVLTYQLTNAPAVEKRNNMTIRRISCIPLLKKTFVLPKALPALEKHDVVITNTRLFTTSLLGVYYAHKWKATHIHVEHGNMHVPHANPLVRFIAWVWDQTLGRFLMLHARHVVCISNKGVKFARNLSARNPKFIPNVIDPKQFSPSKAIGEQVRAHYAIPKTARLIVFVGRLVREKGLFDLLEAMQDSKDYLLIVGDGPARDQLEQLSYELKVKTRFMGAQDAKGVHSALCAADVFVNPSWAEGLPTSVLEALAAKVPVLATDVGGTNEIIGKDNLIPPKQPEVLRKRLKSKKDIPLAPFPTAFAPVAAKRAWNKLVLSKS